MLYLGIFKRFLPFLMTFAAGIFLASFFVPIGLPSLGRPEGSFQMKGCRNMEMEFDRLEDENQALRREMELRNFGPAHLSLPNVPPVDLETPRPPRVQRIR